MIGNINISNIPDKESLEFIILGVCENFRSHDVSISLNSLKHDRIRSVIKNWSYIDFPRQLRIRRFLKELSRRPNIYFLMIKFKKLH